MENLPSPNLNGYTFAEKLGSGSYAAVFRAVSRVPNNDGIRETFAIKCVARAKIAGHSAASNNLVREIGILKTLRHAHIVMLRDFQWDNTYIYLVMEYCAGGDLSHLIRQHRAIPESVTQRFLQQMASALSYLRSRSISHMDLKPQNILLSSKYPPIRLKIADFGFATFLQENRNTAFSVRGSPLYMAPEIITNSYYDARVDLWSVGVILYECLFGRAPLASSSLEELQLQIASDAPILIPKQTPTGPLSANCWDLLSGLLQRDPNHRLNFEQFFQHDWVDLEHIPSEETLEKATNLAQNAINADRAGSHAEAIRLYCKALEYFLPSLQIIHNKDEQEALRRRIRAYIQRAEALKASLRPPELTGPNLEKSVTEIDRLKQLWIDVTEVAAAVTVSDAAKLLEQREQFPEALEKYTLAIESMMSVLKTEPRGVRRDALMAVVERWMKRAECLKHFLAVRSMQLQSMSLNDMKVHEVDECTKHISKESQCTVQ